LGNPFDVIRPYLLDFPDTLQQAMLNDARQSALMRRSTYSPDVVSLWTSPIGQCRIIFLLLKKHHPELSFHQVEELYNDGCWQKGYDYFHDKILVAIGLMPKDEHQLELEVLREFGLLEQEEVEKQPLKPENWMEIDECLIAHFSLKPWEIDELTMTEIMVFFASLAKKQEAAAEQPTDVIPHHRLVGLKKYKEALAKLTPAQKLEFYERTTLPINDSVPNT